MSLEILRQRHPDEVLHHDVYPVVRLVHEHLVCLREVLVGENVQHAVLHDVRKDPFGVGCLDDLDCEAFACFVMDGFFDDSERSLGKGDEVGDKG